MEKKVYLVYASSKGCKDLVYCTIDKADAFVQADAFKRDAVGLPYTVNYRVYEMPLNGFGF